MMRAAPLFVLALSAVFSANAAYAAKHYGLTISTAQTYNISLKNGVFTATGDNAVLSVTDLMIALQSGDTEVTTGNGAGGDEQGDLHIEAGITWNSATTLTLDAYHSIFVDQPVNDGGAGGMSIVTNDGGSGGIFSIGQDPRSVETNGRITFASLSDTLLINAMHYTLVSSVQGLAAGIAANPSGAYALAANYDARRDGTYGSAPVPTTFTGKFDGLGNIIYDLRIRDTQNAEDGLFAVIDSSAAVSHLNLSQFRITALPVYNAVVGALASFNSGLLFEDSAGGSMTATTTTGGTALFGGLVGENTGVIENSSAKAAMTFGPKHGVAGGLVGYDYWSNQNETGAITNSHAKGSINAQARAFAGGLVGEDDGAPIATSYATASIVCTSTCMAGGLAGEITGGFASVSNSYATGNITQLGRHGIMGGLIGYIDSQNSTGVAESYSTGAPSGKATYKGGFVGEDHSSAGSLTSCYWDTDTSGITNLSQGAGYPSNDPGITGQTTAQMQSGLPAGFSHDIWAEKGKFNNGLPYLKYNQPAR